MTPLLEAIEAAFAGIKVYSLPSVGEDGERRHIELGVKGVGDVVEEAYESLLEGVIELGSDFEEV